jgi:type IV secretion system protein VirB11
MYITLRDESSAPALSAQAIQRQRLHEKLTRECGSAFIAALDDPAVIEIMVNEDGRLWLDKFGAGLVDTGYSLTPTAVESILATVASMLDTSLTRENPMVEGEFPLDGSRLEGLLPPVVSAPVITVRKRPPRVFTLDEYLQAAILTAEQVDVIRHAIAAKQNILVVGGTGSGKTTLLNAILAEFPTACPEARIVAIEDTVELQIKVANYVALRATKTVTMNDLLRATLRLRPDRIIFGEVRGGEALALLKAWYTGHPGGAATLHANSATAALTRLEQLIAENQGVQVQPAWIAEVIHWIVYIEKINETPGRRVKEIRTITGWRNGQYAGRLL